jgi:hypothetical protein
MSAFRSGFSLPVCSFGSSSSSRLLCPVTHRRSARNQLRLAFTSAFLSPTGGSSANFRFVCRNRLKCCLCRFALTSSGSVGSTKTDYIALLRDDLTDCSVGRFQDRSCFVWKCCSLGWYSSTFSSTSTMRLACSISGQWAHQRT